MAERASGLDETAASHAPDTSVAIQVEVVCLRDGKLEHVALRLAPGSRVADALVGLLSPAELNRLQAIDELAAADWAQAELTAAIFGQRARTGDLLRAHDRIELLPGLQVDPKLARQRRAEHRRREKGERRWAPDRRPQSV